MAKYDDRNYIGDIDVSDPPGTEDINLGDNWMRSIARALKNAFPNSTGNDAYTGTLSQLNGLVAGESIPRDTIVMWVGDQVANPDGPPGWTVCDGRARKDGLGGTAPNLRSRFIIGAKTNATVDPLTHNVGVTGGNANIDIRTSTGALVDFETEEVILTDEHLAAHTHPLFTTETTSGDGGALGVGDLVAYFGDNVGSNRAYKMQASVSATATVGKTGAAGGGAALGHSHTFQIDGTGTDAEANLPPYYAALYIIKD